jgi:hypothetical protein
MTAEILVEDSGAEENSFSAEIAGTVFRKVRTSVAVPDTGT